ncbi:hypothetical protein FOA52_006426 [Chlamydomonas sp. UWO 241]|nr:hypothetical protein FOA52_006426 [Chlamydomonas sp. UWO 241]
MDGTTLLSKSYAPTGTFEGTPYLVSLRGKDPKKTSTVTMHVASNPEGGRVGGVRSHHFGPGVKLTGGQLSCNQEDRHEGRVRVPRSMDPKEILATYRAEQAEAAAFSTTTSLGLTASAVKSTAGSSAPATQRGPYTASNSQHTGINKTVWFDGLKHIVMDTPAGGVPADWQPPRLKHNDLAPGPLLGVREVGGAPGTKLIASKHRLMLEPGTDLSATLPGTNLPRQPIPSGPLRPPFNPATDGPFGLAPFAPLNQTTSFGSNGNINTDTLKAYAATKMVGHKEYEATCKALDGMSSWRENGHNLTTSMHHEHGWTSTRMVAPKEHMTKRLSMRRG